MDRKSPDRNRRSSADNPCPNEDDEMIEPLPGLEEIIHPLPGLVILKKHLSPTVMALVMEAYRSYLEDKRVGQQHIRPGEKFKTVILNSELFFNRELREALPTKLFVRLFGSLPSVSATDIWHEDNWMQTLPGLDIFKEHLTPLEMSRTMEVYKVYLEDKRLGRLKRPRKGCPVVLRTEELFHSRELRKALPAKLFFRLFGTLPPKELTNAWLKERRKMDGKSPDRNRQSLNGERRRSNGSGRSSYKSGSRESPFPVKDGRIIRTEGGSLVATITQDSQPPPPPPPPTEPPFSTNPFNDCFIKSGRSVTDMLLVWGLVATMPRASWPSWPDRRSSPCQGTS